MNIKGLDFGALHSIGKRTADIISRHRLEIAKAILGRDYRIHPTDGLLLLRDALQIGGTYLHSITSHFRQEDPDCALAYDHNLITDEGIAYALNVILFQTGTYSGGQAQLANWYLGLFNGSTAPTNTTTGANVASTLTEINNSTQGYTQATRPAYVGTAAVSGTASNTASLAAFTIATSTSLVVNGGFMISDNTRGGTLGKCLSAAQFGASRTLYNAEIFNLGYALSLSN